MKHDCREQELLVLSLYDELDDSEQIALEKHLKDCSVCREKLRSFLDLQGFVNRHSEPFPEALLRQARRSLSQKLRAQTSAGQNEKTKRSGLLNSMSHWRPALSAAAMLLAGLGLGFALFHHDGQSLPPTDSAGLNSLNSPEVLIANVRFKMTEAGNSEVTLSFDAVRRVTIQGRIEDARIQTLLAYALVNEQNPGVRLRAVGAIGQVSHNSAGNESIEAALVTALKSDGNPAVRRTALEALRSFPPSSAIQEALFHVLAHDDNPKVRIEAIESLSRAIIPDRPADTRFLNLLQDRVQSEPNDYIRQKAKNLLQEVSRQ